MMNLEQSPSRTWQWDSHQDPKHSRWLQSSLKELDEKVRAMLMLIEADADSFAQRAEMYYQKRPELLNMVEEFYRAHRYLAERYDHLSGEIKQNIPKALQVQYGLSCDSPRGSPFGRSAGRRDQQGFERLLKKFEAGHSDEQAQSVDSEIVDASESDIKENGLLQEELSSSSSSSDSEVDSTMEVEKLQQAVQNLEQENKKMALHCQTTIEENKSLENRVNGLQQELLKFQEERLKLVDTCEIGMKQAAALENKVRELGEELLRLQEENAKLSDETSRVAHLNEIEQELSTLQQEKKVLKEQMFESNEERDRLQRNVDLLQEEGMELRAIALEREDKKKNLEEVVSRLQEDNQRLTAEISAATEHGKIVITALKFMKGAFSSLVQRNKKLREEILEKPAKETLQAQQEEILKLEVENEKVKNDLQDFCVVEEKRVNELNVKIKELHRQITFLGEENRKQKLVILDRAEEKREAIRQLCFSMDVLKEKNQRLEEALSSAKTRLHVFRNTSHRLPTWKRVLLGPWNGLPKSQPYALAL